MRRTRRTALLLILVPLGAGCVRTHVHDSVPALADGRMEGATLSIGGQPYELAICRSGDREYFLGVDLADRADRAALRVVIDPMDGPRLRVVLKGAGERKDVVLGRDSCRRLEATIQPTGWWVNRVRDFGGSLDADCAGAGLDVVAHVRFAHCH
jgi:hypothetical protein